MKFDDLAIPTEAKQLAPHQKARPQHFRTSPIPPGRLQETRVCCAARYNNAVSPVPVPLSHASVGHVLPVWKYFKYRVVRWRW